MGESAFYQMTTAPLSEEETQGIFSGPEDPPSINMCLAMAKKTLGLGFGTIRLEWIGRECPSLFS